MPLGFHGMTERPSCVVCGRQIETPPSNHATLNTCRRWQCRGHRLAQEAQRQLDARAKNQRAQIRSAALSQAAKEGHEDADELLHVVIPATDAPVVPVSDALRNAMTLHLETQASGCNEQSAVTLPQPRHPTAEPWQSFDEDIPASEQALWSNACATCRGQCCHYGAETMAFITVETLTRYATAVQPRSPQGEQETTAPIDVIRDYVAHIPTQHIANSCIFHTETGCALPRNMRADICNRFVCNGLAELHEAYHQRPSGLLITAISNGRLRRQKVVTLDGQTTRRSQQSDSS